MGKGVWVKADVVEGKATVHPVSTLERPAYSQYLARHFACLDDGFFFRVRNNGYTRCPCSRLFVNTRANVVYEVYSPLANLLFTGVVIDPDINTHPINSSVDSDSEMEENSEGTFVLLSDSKTKSVIRLCFSKDNIYKSQVTRVESPPGVLLGWIRKHHRLCSPNVYHLFEETEPREPNAVLRRCSSSESAADDGDSHDIGCFACFPSCGASALKSAMYEVREPSERSGKPADTGLGVIYGSQQGNTPPKAADNEKITCVFSPGISYKKKVLILTSVIVIHQNKDIA